MTRKLAALGLAALMIVVVLTSLAMGPVAASHNAEDATEYHNETLTVDNDTERAYIDVEDTNGTDAHVYWYGIDNDTETGVMNETISASSGEVVTSNVTVDPDTYDSYRVVLEGDSNTEAPTSTNAGLVGRLDGGGGASSGLGFLADTVFGVPYWFIAIIAIGAVGFYAGRGQL